MIFIEEIKGSPYNEDGVALAKYFEKEKIEYQLIKKETIKYLNYPILNNLFVGTVEFMKEIFFYKDSHPSMPFNNLEDAMIMKAEYVRKLVSKGNVYFIKPYGYKNIKKFDGFVCDKYSLNMIEHYSGDILCYPPFKKHIESEWRIFIDNGRVIDLKNYSGKPFVFPNMDYVNEVIEVYDEMLPASYCIDVGVLEDDENVVIEFTDMWSVASYGIDPRDYFRCLKNRYYQLIGEK